MILREKINQIKDAIFGPLKHSASLPPPGKKSLLVGTPDYLSTFIVFVHKKLAIVVDSWTIGEKRKTHWYCFVLLDDDKISHIDYPIPFDGIFHTFGNEVEIFQNTPTSTIAIHAPTRNDCVVKFLYTVSVAGDEITVTEIGMDVLHLKSNKVFSAAGGFDEGMKKDALAFIGSFRFER